MNKIRTIPESDLKISNYNISLNEEYKDGVFCDCNIPIIKFKNRKLHETVIIECPTCGRKIMYG